MIGRVYRGFKVGGLVRYLYGPGRHNEHVDQHLVACWSGTDVQALAAVEPETTGSRSLTDPRSGTASARELGRPGLSNGKRW